MFCYDVQNQLTYNNYINIYIIMYLCYYVALSVNNAATPIREIAPDLKVPAFVVTSSSPVLGWDSDSIVPHQTGGIGFFQDENQAL